ncbi:hypothetical protein P376_5318 [Streptomyces sp. HCCB10043]|nr:hypothetical protein P376_5318 [Streptomyces sp. HCCB10043]EWS89940.1 hypothetical protein SSIG_07656 [Streptomyces filamentosus NRRL 11379]
MQRGHCVLPCIRSGSNGDGTPGSIVPHMYTSIDGNRDVMKVFDLRPMEAC